MGFFIRINVVFALVTEQIFQFSQEIRSSIIARPWLEFKTTSNDSLEEAGNKTNALKYHNKKIKNLQ